MDRYSGTSSFLAKPLPAWLLPTSDKWELELAILRAKGLWLPVSRRDWKNGRMGWKRKTKTGINSYKVSTYRDALEALKGVPYALAEQVVRLFRPSFR